MTAAAATKDPSADTSAIPSRFVMQSGLGHNGSKWLATVLNRPDWGIKATHERKNEALKQPWDKLLQRELIQGIDRGYLPYLEALDADLTQHSVVLDANSFQMVMVPALHRAFPIDLLLVVVRNGIPSVESMFRHNQGTPQMEWLEGDYLKHYWNYLGKPRDEFDQLGSFEKWCFWWSLNAEMLPRLRHELGSDRVMDVRFEDLIGDTAVFRSTVERVLGDHPMPALSDDEIQSLQGEDINRKLDGDRRPESIWDRWDDNRRHAFIRFCSPGMAQWGYDIPGHELAKPAASPVAQAYLDTMVRTVTGSESATPAARAQSQQTPHAVSASPVLPVDLPVSQLPLPSDPTTQLDVIDADHVHRLFGWNPPYMTAPLSRAKQFKDWKMEEDDQPLFRYLWRQHQAKRHLEFGTWQGEGVIYVLEETKAAVWTVNLLSGELDDTGRNSYSFYAHERAELEAWAKRIGFDVSSKRSFATDSLGFIGRKYLMRDAGNRVAQIYADSTRWDDAPYPDGFFDSILIDGGHTADVVESDTRKALRLARSGGLLVWHDVCPELYGKTETVTGVFDGLAKVYDEVKAQTSALVWLKPSLIMLGVKR